MQKQKAVLTHCLLVARLPVTRFSQSVPDTVHSHSRYMSSNHMFYLRGEASSGVSRIKTRCFIVSSSFKRSN